MLGIARELSRWCATGTGFAVATVVGADGSVPRRPGAALAVDAHGTAVGSVSGGCVEAAVYELCRRALDSDETLLEHFAYDEDDPFAAHLPCGGATDVLVTPVRGGSPDAATLSAALTAAVGGEAVAVVRAVDGRGEASALTAAVGGEAVAVVRAVDGRDAARGRLLLVRADGSQRGTLGGGTELDRAAAAQARAMLAAGRTRTVRVAAGGSPCGSALTVLIETTAPPPRLLVFGANDFAAALVDVGAFLGFHVTVCDARAVFTTPARFPRADEVVVAWPHRYLESQRLDARSVLCVLTHDAKFDVPLLQRALRLPVAYVGAMGSRRTHHERLRRLRAAGLTEAELARLRSPVGLDLGACTPQETALSIAAEIIAERHGGTGLPLTGTSAPLHRDPAGGGREGLVGVDRVAR
ncbi:XdhC/CoxI family protein [Streptomyces sp. NPDC046261]|uniref:XdhC family protein n=1 Tax=Streptomyces sp. NPDC046261 TaxID=3157200 RepID=UPI003402D2A7